jgi:predicted transcriptional regulator
VSARTNALVQALDRLAEALAEPESAISRDAAIQRFEFSFELAWRAIQERARDQGLDCRSPKGCV